MFRFRLRPVATALIITLLIGLFFILARHERSTLVPVSLALGNGKLGFDDIYIVTAGRSQWRAKGLEAAAKRTDLNVTFLKQPEWTKEQKQEFHTGDNYSTWDIPGSTGCWLGHFHALEHFLAQGQSSALLLEDDADWDVKIHDQVDRTSQAVRQLTQSADRTGWGDKWDILFLGHCGDRLPDQHHAFKDPSTPNVSSYIGFDYGTLQVLASGTRAVHQSVRPVCTFGYAVTSQGAQKILALDHNAKAIDIRLGRACKYGELQCITVNPELVHHHVPAGEAPSEIQIKQDVVNQAWTANILHSARCNVNRSNDDLYYRCSLTLGKSEQVYVIEVPSDGVLFFKAETKREIGGLMRLQLVKF